MLRVVTDGGVTTRPPENVVGKPTARVLDPVRAVTGLTVIGMPIWPVTCGLQLTVMDVGDRTSLLVAWRTPEPRANPTRATDSRVVKARNIDVLFCGPLSF